MAGPKPFHSVTPNLCKEVIEVDNKLDLSLGLIPDITVNPSFSVMFSFRFPQKDNIPRNKCQLSAYENSLLIKAVILSLLHFLLPGHSEAEARPPSCPGLTMALVQLPRRAVAGG